MSAKVFAFLFAAAYALARKLGVKLPPNLDN